MSLISWKPLEEPFTFRRELDRLFDNFLSGERGLSKNGDWYPDVDLAETDEEIVAKMDLPGLNQKDIKVSMSGNMLQISGERREEREEKKRHFYRLERKFGRFDRVIQIPAAVDSTRVRAEYDKGILEVHLPRRADSKPQQIPVAAK